ncbi:MAG: anthranilate synthase component I, partial [Acidobacteriota bacterium]|nr:anthranilate synthase component I [Acidobacteriota bacterium]
MALLRYTTPRGITVTRTASKTPYRLGLKRILRDLDTHRGVYLSSGYEFPGRYSRWDFASSRPPLELISRARQVMFRPLNSRGEAINRILEPVLANHPHWDRFERTEGELRGTLKPMPALFPEEQRSKQPSVFSVLRALTEEFRTWEDDRLSLIGAFGYDLLFQFEPIKLTLPRDGHEDLHLFLCDDIYYMDRKREQVERFQYDFERSEITTAGLPRDADSIPSPAVRQPGPITSDHTAEEYMAKVETVR